MHTGLLQVLDTNIDQMESRLSQARWGLDQVAQGTRENGQCFFLVFLFVIPNSFLSRIEGDNWGAHPHHHVQDMMYAVVYTHTSSTNYVHHSYE
jgi:hypothetical protein